jgi:Flp pilus assembly pilin Flp
MSKIIAYMKDENGASLTDYALIVGIIGAAVALVLVMVIGSAGAIIDRAGK